MRTDSFSEDLKAEYDLGLGESGFISEKHLNFTLGIFFFICIHVSLPDSSVGLQ